MKLLYYDFSQKVFSTKEKQKIKEKLYIKIFNFCQYIMSEHMAHKTHHL